MAVHIKSEEEIEKMRVAGRLAAEVLEMIEPHVKPGMTTDELNTICHDYIVNVQNTTPAPLNYISRAAPAPFPKSICTSVNEQICHGIPSDKPLKGGDILNIDITIIKDGYHGDTSKMFVLEKTGNKSKIAAAKRLVDVAREAMIKGINQVKPGATLGDIGHAIQTHAQSNHYSIVREYCGHGIGLGFHEEPQVLHYGKPGIGLKLEPGMTFTIEPMVNQGKRYSKVLKDGWTVATRDRSLSAQWEHTILVTADGHEVLTLRNGEVI